MGRTAGELARSAFLLSNLQPPIYNRFPRAQSDKELQNHETRCHLFPVAHRSPGCEDVVDEALLLMKQWWR
jgi:hypothetical protein